MKIDYREISSLKEATQSLEHTMGNAMALIEYIEMIEGHKQSLMQILKELNDEHPGIRRSLKKKLEALDAFAGIPNDPDSPTH